MPVCICGHVQESPWHCWRIGGHLGENCGCRKGALDLAPYDGYHYFKPKDLLVPDDTLKAAEDAAREAVLKAARSFGGPNRGVHGEVSEAWVIGALNNYRDAIIARKDAEHAALRAAAERMNAILWRKDLMGFDYAAEYQDAAKQLKAALDATPWEPSEEMVERARAAIERWDAEDHPYEVMARAALKAALNPPPAGQPASA